SENETSSNSSPSSAASSFTTSKFCSSGPLTTPILSDSSLNASVSSSVFVLFSALSLLLPHPAKMTVNKVNETNKSNNFFIFSPPNNFIKIYNCYHSNQ